MKAKFHKLLKAKKFSPLFNPAPGRGPSTEKSIFTGGFQLLIPMLGAFGAIRPFCNFLPLAIFLLPSFKWKKFSKMDPTWNVSIYGHLGFGTFSEFGFFYNF